MRTLSEVICAIRESTFGAIRDRLPDVERRPTSVQERAAAIGVATARPASREAGSIAIIPITGVLSQRGSFLDWLFGGSSTEYLTAALRQAVVDPNVRAIVLDVDSPGGSVFGIQELGDAIFRARGSKPIVAVANAQAASAAYWLSTQADELIVTPSGEVGSIGVIATHDDLSDMAAKLGVKRTFITFGKYKAEGNEFEPLGDAALAYLQRRVNEYGEAFIAAVSRGRGVPASRVREGFGQGRMVSAADALRVGMVDRIAPLSETVGRLILSASQGAPKALAARMDLDRRRRRLMTTAAPSDDVDLDRRRRRLRLLELGG